MAVIRVPLPFVASVGRLACEIRRRAHLIGVALRHEEDGLQVMLPAVQHHLEAQIVPEITLGWLANVDGSCTSRGRSSGCIADFL
ncbi:MAG: hypothetical protein N2040_06515, partial [Caldimonas manganoxidans]|nr:hypothetical protein [Caldimonas manganoxidans]